MKIVRSKFFVALASLTFLATDHLVAKDAYHLLLEEDVFSPRFSFAEGYGSCRGEHSLYTGLAVESFKPETIFWKGKFDYFAPTGHNKFHVYEIGLEGNIGYTFRFDHLEDLSVALFSGLGFDHFDAHKGLAKNQNLYVPLGFYLDGEASESFRIGLSVQANLMLARTLEVTGTVYHVSRTIPWRVQLPLRYLVNDHWDVSCVPFWKYEPAYSKSALGLESVLVLGLESTNESASMLGVMIQIGYKL